MDVLLASQAGDEKELKRLLSTDSSDVNYCNDCGETPLILACKFIYTNCCSLLLDAGADVNLCDCVGNSPIHFADSIDIVTRLLDLKADPFLKNVLGRTPLHEAAIWGNIRRFKVVLDEFTYRKYSVDVFDGEQCTPLHLAAISVDRESRMEKITLLLSAGAYIDQPNAQEKTPLRLACTNFDICETTALHLLENGANPNALDAYGNTCVHALFQFNPYYSTDMTEDSAEMAVLNSLLRAGCTLNIRNSHGQTALHYAAHKTSSQPIPLLIQNGADPLVTDNIGRTPLHKTMYNEDVEMTTIFLQYSKCLSAVDYFGRTPLHYAAAHSKTDVVEAVTEALASSEEGLGHIINSQDNFGFRPLHYFLLYKRHEIPVLECLLHHGANVHHTLPLLDCMDMAWYSQDVQRVLMAADTGNNLNAEQVLAPSNLQDELSYCLPPISIDTVKDIDPITLRPLKDVDEYTKQINSLTIPSDIKKKAYECMNLSIEIFVRNLCDGIKNLDQRFTFAVIPSGSSYEGTKPVTHFTQSDFDYMICLERFSEVVEVEESPSLNGYVKLSKRKSLGNDSQFDEFFSDGYLVGNKVSKKFCDLVVHVMNQPEIWRGGKMECPCTPTLEFESGSPTIKLNLFWKDDFIHAHNVSLDIVPAIQVKSWWPSFARDESVLFTADTKECHIVLKQPDVPSYSLEKFGNPTHLLRVSFSVAEREIFRKLSHMVRQCYLVIKVLSKRKIKVPLWIFYEDSSKSAMFLKSTFTSYILKNAFLFELEGIYKEDMHFDVDSFDSKRIISGTFRRLTQACATCILPSFFVPSHNIIHSFRKDGFVMRSRYIVMQLLEMSVQEAGETHDLCVKRFTERENTDFLTKRHRKTKTFLYKMGISWLN